MKNLKMETVWSGATGRNVKVSVLDEERGHLYLRDDPKSWIESNRNKLLLVRKLELQLHENHELEEIQESSIGELKELTHLYISWGQNLKFLPNSITKLHKLQVLEINGCVLIKELPKNLGYLKNLTHLSLSNCRELVELPASMGQLKNLTHLSLSNCRELVELPASTGELKNLTHIELFSCGQLAELPASLGELKNLTHLKLHDCSDLAELPVSIGQLKNLTHLELSSCSKLAELPASMGQLKNLTHLKLYKCRELVELPASMGQLKNLTRVSLVSCSKIKSLSNVMEVLHKLEKLEISDCSSLVEVPPNANNGTMEESAKALNVSGSSRQTYGIASDKFIVKATYKDDTVEVNFSRTSTIDQLREEVGKMLKLQENKFKIKYRDAENDLLLLTSIDELWGVSRSPNSNTVEVHVFDKDDTVKFNLSRTSTIDQLHEEVGKMLKLEENNFKIKHRDAKNELGGVSRSPNSNTVEVHVYDKDDEGYLCLRDDPSKWIECNRAKRLLVRKLKLDISKRRGLKEIGDSIVELEELTHLHISGGDNLNCLPNSITRLHKLKVLEICCFRLKELPENLGDLKCLTHLSLEFCLNITNLPESLGQLKSLTHLSLNYCVELAELPKSLGQLKSLTHVSLYRCSKIQSLSNVRITLENLASLKISKCSSIKDLPPNAFVNEKERIEVPPELIRLLIGEQNMAVEDNIKPIEVSRFNDGHLTSPQYVEGIEDSISNHQEITHLTSSSDESSPISPWSDNLITHCFGFIFSFLENFWLKTCIELKSEIYQNDPPQCQREIDDVLASTKGEKMVSDACCPVHTKRSNKKSSLGYEENKDMLHRDMDTGISACNPIHTEPLIEVCAVTIIDSKHNLDPFKIYGEIYVGGEGDEKQLIYTRNEDDYETITSGGSLLLNGLDSNVVSMVDPIEMTIKLKNFEEKGGNEYFAYGKIKLDTETTSCYEEVKSSTLTGTLRDVKVSYIVVPCGVVADVQVRIVKEVGDQQDFVDIFGTIMTRYGCSIDYPWNVLYQKQEDECSLQKTSEHFSSVLYHKQEHDCDQVSYGESIELCRSLVCLPAYSSLLVDVDISLKESGTAETIVITGSKDFKCTESAPVEKNISEGNFDVIVTVYWGSSYQLQCHQKTQPSSSIDKSMPFFGNSRIEVLSIFVGSEGNKTIDHQFLCGTILVDHWDGFAYIFRSDNEKTPRNLSGHSKAISLKGQMSYRTDQIYMYLKLKYCKDDNHEEVSDNMAINSCFILDKYYYEHISRQWFDRPLCSVIMGNNGFAAVHYIVFKDAVKATLKISVTENDSSSHVAGAFVFVYGNVVASYGAYKYSTKYEKNFCRSVLFEEPEKNNSCQLPEDGEIPLFRNVVSVPMGSSLIVDVNLHASLRPNGVSDGNFENLECKVILEIGGPKFKKIVRQGYELLFSIE